MKDDGPYYYATSRAEGALRLITDALQAADRSHGHGTQADLNGFLRNMDDALEASRRALPAGKRAPYRMADYRTSDASHKDEEAEAKEDRAPPPPAPEEQEKERTGATTEPVQDDVTHLKISALADVCAVAAEVLGVDSYFNVNWLDTITSKTSTISDVEDARKGMIDAFNKVIPLRDED